MYSYLTSLKADLASYLKALALFMLARRDCFLANFMALSPSLSLASSINSFVIQGGRELVHLDFLIGQILSNIVKSDVIKKNSMLCQDQLLQGRCAS